MLILIPLATQPRYAYVGCLPKGRRSRPAAPPCPPTPSLRSHNGTHRFQCSIGPVKKIKFFRN